MSSTDDVIEQSMLGKETSYDLPYSADHLYPIPRQLQRDIVGITHPLPFKGFDIWNAYELSWLTPSGKPQVAIGTFAIPSDSPHLIESKSFKLYFNGFNQTRFESWDEVATTMRKDLTEAAGAPVSVTLSRLEDAPAAFADCHATSIDHLDVTCTADDVSLEDLTSDASHIVEETLSSDLLRSLCLATGQPDWASVMIHYKGPKIDEAGLLRYIISSRNHKEFHEHCVERMFTEIQAHCKPESLTIYARYTRRGGLDINPWRSTEESPLESINNSRFIRQ